MPRSVLLIGDITHCRPRWESFSSIASLKEFKTTREEFLANCKSGKYDDVVAIYRSNASNKFTGNFDQELVSSLPNSIKFICHNGAGYDNIDVRACSDRGILISSTPIAVNKATADIAIFLMLGALRFAWIPIKGIREHNWQGSGYQLGYDPEEKTLGILGMGGIGGEVAKRAKAFDMKVIYHNRHRLPAEKECGAEYVSFDELLARTDVLSLNLSLNPSTKHIISTEEFKKMKEGVVIINTARGALIDEDALVKALDAGKIRSVGLDVYENEPSVHEGLLRNEKVMLLPHLGTGTWETQKKMEDLVLDNLREALEKGRLITPIPEQKGVYGEITSKM